MRNATFGIGCFVAYLLLGLIVTHGPVGFVDRNGEELLLGKAVPLALAFTEWGMLPVYAVICIALLVYAFFQRAWFSRVAFSIAALVTAWVVSDTGKHFFARPRPEHWIAIHETSSSYASGHATLSLVFYGLWLRFLADTDMGVWARRVSVGVFLLLIIGMGWSRLALGAHYVSDVIGGYFLGGALLCAASFFSLHRPPPKACA